MCGFVGGLLQKTLDEKRLDQALESIHHPGPHSPGRWISDDGRWLPRHTRLSILGPDNGEHATAHESGGVQMGVNGAFYR